MTTTLITGQGATYTGNAEDTASNNSSVHSTGATAEEPYVVKIGKFVLRATSQEEADSFLAWLSNMAGKPIDKLTVQDVLRFVKVSDLKSSFSGYDANEKRPFTSFSVKDTQWATIDEFNDTQFFGDEIPQFPAGSGSFFGARLELAKPGEKLDAGLTGFMGTAQLIYNSNYPAGEELQAINTNELDAGVKELLQKMFGPNTVFNQGHLNVLKMMNLVSGAADKPISTWALTTGVGAPLLQAFKDNPQVFIAAVSLFNLTDAMIAEAKGVSQYFDDGGNFVLSYGVTDVEKVAASLITGMSPPETALPAGTQLGERVRNMLNALFSLDPANATFTAEQINTAIAMGLVSYNATTGMVELTGNGRGYLTVKNPDGQDAVQEPGTTETTSEQHLENYWNSWNYLLHNGGTQMMDYLEAYEDDGRKNGKADDNNKRFGGAGLGELANLTTNSFFWERAGLGHLSNEQRQTLIDHAKSVIANPRHAELWNQMTKINGGSGIEGAVTEKQIRSWLSNTKDTWKPQLEQYRTRYNDTSLQIPDHIRRYNVGIAHFTNSEWEAMNKLCENIFGKKFDQMTIDERRKAIYVLSTGVPPLLTANEKTIQPRHPRESARTTLDVSFTASGINYLKTIS